MGPFEKNEPSVQRGIDAYQAGKYEDALQAFEEAKKALPNSAAVEFNRGNALFKLNRLDEAKEAYHHVAAMDPRELAAKDYYNLGDAWAQMGNKKEAMTAFRKALTLDPSDNMARHNLEVLLRDVPPPQNQPDGGTDGGQDAGQPDGGRDGGAPDAGRDGGSDAGTDGGSDGGQSGGDGGTDGGSDGGQGKGRGNQRGDAGQPQPKPDENGTDGGAPDDGFDGGEQEQPQEWSPDAGVEANLSKKDAERLLDSMKQTEKNLQLWRFQVKKRSRKPNEKDW